MTWVTTEIEDAVHVHPFYETGHILGPWCWCAPRVEDGEDERGLFIHRDQLERTTRAD